MGKRNDAAFSVWALSHDIYTPWQPDKIGYLSPFVQGKKLRLNLSNRLR